METRSVIICYWGDDKDVLWNDFETDNVHYYIDTLFGRMEKLICDGHITEVLEYHPALPDSNGHSIKALNDRCDWWRKRLRKEGYEIDHDY